MLRRRVGQAEVDAGAAPEVPTESAWEIGELKRTCAELEHTIEVLEGGEEFLCAGVRPATSLICQFIT
jgi:hypothetical protein